MSAVRREFSLVERLHASNVRPDMKSLHGRGTETSAASGVLTELLCLHVRSCRHPPQQLGCTTLFVLTRGNSPQPHDGRPVNGDGPRWRQVEALLNRDTKRSVTARRRCSPRPPPTSTSASAHKSDLEIAPRVNKGFHKANGRLQLGWCDFMSRSARLHLLC